MCVPSFGSGADDYVEKQFSVQNFFKLQLTQKIYVRKNSSQNHVAFALAREQSRRGENPIESPA